MGEARRRRAAQHARNAVKFRNMLTGRVEEARLAGSPLETLRRRDDQTKREALGERVEVPVPCNGCVSCCYHRKVDVYPETERQEDLEHLDVIPHPEGGFALRKRPAGGCVHLGVAGCTVRKHRPRACRMYDCRVFAIAGLQERFDGNHVSPAWLPALDTPEDRALVSALQINIARYTSENPDSNAQDRFDYAIEHLNETLPTTTEFVKQFDRLPAEKKAEFDRWFAQTSERLWAQAEKAASRASGAIMPPRTDQIER